MKSLQKRVDIAESPKWRRFGEKKKLPSAGLKVVFSYANEMKTACLSTAVEKSHHC